MHCVFYIALLSSVLIFFLIIRRPPRSTRTDTLFPYPTLFRSRTTPLAGKPEPSRRSVPVPLGGSSCGKFLPAGVRGYLARYATNVDGATRLSKERDRKSTRLNSSH